MSFDPAAIASLFGFRQRSVGTPLPLGTLLAKADSSRVLLIISSPIASINVQPDVAIGVNSTGIIVGGSTILRLEFASNPSLVGAAWYGFNTIGGNSVYVLEEFRT